MQSLLKTAVSLMKTSVRVFATLAIVALSIAALSDRAHALTISVGTGSIAGLPAAPSYWDAKILPNQTFGVLYTTASSTNYTIMFASQVAQSGLPGAGGGAPGWTLTTFSTGAISATSNIPSIMDYVVRPDGQIIVYYYDPALGHLRVLSGAASSAPLLPVSVSSATIGGIKLLNDGSHVQVLFSSQVASNSSGRYELVFASVAAAGVTTPFVAATGVHITTVAHENPVSEFALINQTETGVNTAKIYYYDSVSNSLREVSLNSSNAAIESARGTIDSGVITKIVALESGTGVTGATRLVYTVGGSVVKYAVQRRNISGQCWYIQKLDDGTASQNVFTVAASGSDLDPRISYIKSGNLWEARGVQGTFFDDFSESITNKQLGLVNLISNVTSGKLMQSVTGATRDRGVFQPSTGNNALGTFNWTTLKGNVVNTFGTAIQSVSIADTVTASAAIVGSAGNATLSPSASSGRAGGLTDGSGNYQINVASGSVNALAVSSSPWVFIHQSSRTLSTTSTMTAVGVEASGAAANFVANFIGYSNAVLDSISDGGSQRTSTFSAIYNNTTNLGMSFTVGSLGSSVQASGFNRSSRFRLVPQTAQGTAPTVTASTAPSETGAISFPQAGTSATSVTVATSTLFSAFASTDTSSLPKWYTLVVTTVTDTGSTIQAVLVDALNVRPLSINFSSVSAGAVGMPNVSGSAVVYSTSQLSSSEQTTIVLISSFTNNFTLAIATDNVYLTTSAVPIVNATFGNDIPLTINHHLINGSTLVVTGSVLGIDASQTWYVRLASKPATADTGWQENRQPHVAFSPAIQFADPAITAVAAENGSDATFAFSSGTVKFKINGRGFTVGSSSVTFSTSTTLVSGWPRYPGGVVSGLSVISSTAMEVAFRANANVSTATTRFHVYVGTRVTPGSDALVAGTFNRTLNTLGGGVVGSTILVNSTVLSSVGPVVIGTPAITAIEPATVVHTSSWTMSLKGRGLLAGGTLYFYATDGSTATPVTTTVQVPATGGMNNGVTVLTARVDFRNQVFAGKTFAVFYTSFTDVMPDNGSIEVSTNVLRIGSGNATVFCSSMNAAIDYPKLSNTNASTIYNSTPSLDLGLTGAGLVAGATVTLNALTGQYFNNNIFLSGNGSAIAPTGATAVSSGAFAVFYTTAFHQAAAGNYTVTIASRIATFGNIGLTFTASTTCLVNVTAASLSAATLASHSAAVVPIQVASYTLTGAGLLPNVTFYLNLAGHDRIGANAVRSANNSNFSSVGVSFDLRAATATSAAWTIVGVSNNTSGSTQTLTSPALTISTIPTIGVIPTGIYKNDTKPTIVISGSGLTVGATGQVFFQGGTVFSTNGWVANYTTDVSNIRRATITVVNGAPITSQSTGTLSLDITGAFPSSSWFLQMNNWVNPGSYGGLVYQIKEDDGTGTLAAANRAARTFGAHFFTNTSSFTVSESSAPDAPTALTVLSAGAASVTLQWVSPGNDGRRNALGTGSNFIVYYSSGDATRGIGCAPCYPRGAEASAGGFLTANATNFSFLNTWAQYLPVGHVNSQKSTDTSFNPNFYQSFSSNTVLGLSVSTVTVPISALTIRTSTAGSATGESSVLPGRVVEATLSISPGATAGDFWFAVRAQDELGNISPTDVVYSTAFARIGASAVTVTDTIDPNATTTLASTDLGGGVASGGTIPPGALDGSDTLTRVADTNPPASSGGANIVGPAVDISLGSGKTEFKKAITLTFTLSGSALATVQAANASLVKVAFFNGSRWVLIRESSFSGGVVSCQVTHLTKFAVAIAAPPANLNSALVYPNPFRPAVASQLAQGMTFDSLPANSTVKIYTLAGDLVKQLDDPEGDGIITWNAKNENGQDVASGVYFALLKGGGDTKTLKVAVQR